MKHKTLHPGCRLYHGTSAAEPFEIDGGRFNDLSFFSTHKSVAEYFTRTGDFARQRIIVCTLWRPAKLAVLVSANDIDSACGFNTDGCSGKELAQAFWDNNPGLDGWFIPQNYDNKYPDILIGPAGRIVSIKKVIYSDEGDN